MDAFKDRLSQRARDTSRPALAHQSSGRALTQAETGFAAALMDIYRTGAHDFGAVAAELSRLAIEAPRSGSVEWSVALLEDELSAINAELDAAYAEHGYGA